MVKRSGNKSICLFLSLLFLSALILLPGNVSRAAAADTIQKEIQYETTKKEDKREDEFPERIEQDGGTYIRKQIDYKTVREEAIKNRVPVFLERKSSVLALDEDYSPDTSIEENGIAYELMQTSEKKKTLQQGYTQTVTGYSLYDSKAGAKRAADTKTIKAVDERSGEDVYVTCKKKGDVKKTAATWENTYIDVVFITYDATHFIWNGVIVEKNTKEPLKGYYKELLESVGGNEKTYQVKDVFWNGKSYKNKNGVLCRRARASVRKKVPHYRVDYAGVRTVKAVKGFIYTSTYAGLKEIDTGEVRYSVLASATYEKVQESKAPIVVMTVGICFGLLIVVGILLLLSAKKKKKRE